MQTAQPTTTTTSRTALTTKKLLQNHAVYLVALNQVRALNEKSLDKSEEFLKVEDYFFLNLNESNFMASEGKVKVIGSKWNPKHQKNTSDSRDSITAVRIGSSGPSEGPRVYLAHGKQV